MKIPRYSCKFIGMSLPTPRLAPSLKNATKSRDINVDVGIFMVDPHAEGIFVQRGLLESKDQGIITRV